MTRLDAQQMVESAEQRTNRLIRLPKRRDTENYRACQTLSRSWVLVAPALRDCFARLATAKARWPLYLWGDVGTGKTRGVLAFLDAIQFGRYWTVDQLKTLMIERRPPWDRAWGWGIAPYLGVLDEVGTHKAKDFEYDAVKDFADWREDQPAIYVSNQPPEMLVDLYDRRIASRLTCGTVFELVDRDRRISDEEDGA